jgi:hypothetical protein
MLSLASTLRIFLAIEPADMRKGFDGLSQRVRSGQCQGFRRKSHDLLLERAFSPDRDRA